MLMYFKLFVLGFGVSRGLNEIRRSKAQPHQINLGAARRKHNVWNKNNKESCHIDL